jgi:UDPglucose 6-dehydrogenase
MKLAVIGLGKLGLPLAALFAANGNRVRVFDVSEAVRSNLKFETVKSNEPGLIPLLKRANLNIQVCDEVSETIMESEVVFIIVPTPSKESGHYTNEYVVDVVKNIGNSLSADQKIVIDIVSTVMPGSCEGEIRAELENSAGRKVGETLGLCYNPEFIALGSVIHDMEEPDMHLIGQSDYWAGDLVEKALKTIVKKNVPSRRMNLTEAELVKISVNNFVTMKVSYANMLYQAALSLGNIDIDVVTNAIGLDSRIGSKYLKAASPYGGPCFPRDTRALSAIYRDLGLSDSLSEATDVINRAHASFLAEYISNQVEPGETVGIAGFSYKTGTAVTEESPGLAIGRELVSRGFRIAFWDDENAEIVSKDAHPQFVLFDTPQELLKESSFILISRPLNDPAYFLELVMGSNKGYLDLWRQVS